MWRGLGGCRNRHGKNYTKCKTFNHQKKNNPVRYQTFAERTFNCFYLPRLVAVVKRWVINPSFIRFLQLIPCRAPWESREAGFWEVKGNILTLIPTFEPLRHFPHRLPHFMPTWYCQTQTFHCFKWVVLQPQLHLRCHFWFWEYRLTASLAQPAVSVWEMR